jgi:arsenate reductase
MVPQRTRVLFLGSGDACRALMAAGWMQRLGSAWVEVQAASIDTQGHNPRAIAVMREAGVDIAQQESARATPALLAWADLLVIVGDHADAHCPALPAGTHRWHWPLPDCARAAGSEVEVLMVFRAARDDIRARVARLIERLRSSKCAVA